MAVKDHNMKRDENGMNKTIFGNWTYRLLKVHEKRLKLKLSSLIIQSNTQRGEVMKTSRR